MLETLIADYFTFLRVGGWVSAMLVCWLQVGGRSALPQRSMLALGMFCAGQAVFGFGGFFHYDVLSFGEPTRAWLTLGKLASFGCLWEFARQLRSADFLRLASPVTHVPLLAVLVFGASGSVLSLLPATTTRFAGLVLPVLPALIAADAFWQSARRAGRSPGWSSMFRGLVSGAITTGSALAAAVCGGAMMMDDLPLAVSMMLSWVPWLLAGLLVRNSLRAVAARSRLPAMFGVASITLAAAGPVFVALRFGWNGEPAGAGEFVSVRTALLAGGLLVVFCQAGFLLTWRLVLDGAQSLEIARREAASQARTEFLAFLGHELRTPLQTILGRAELMQSAGDPGTWAAAVQTIATEGRLMLRLVSDLLDFGTIEAGHFELRPQPISLRALLASVTGAADAMARTKGLALVLEVAPDVPDGIMADGARLHQVIGNLLGNAVKFTAVGGVELRVERAAPARRAATSEAPLRFVVRDSGIGLPPQEIARLFTPFTRLAAGHGPVGDGTGLGLALVKRLVARMGGTVTAANRADGAGAEFVVELTLPAAAVEAAGVDEVVAPAREVLPFRQRVLVVEDHPAARDLLADFLRSLGHEPTAVGDGAAARTALTETTFDAVLLDISLPGEDGTLLAREIVGVPRRFGRPRLIGLSADAAPGIRALALAAGMAIFLTKPVSRADLQSALRGIAAEPHDLFSTLRSTDVDSMTRTRTLDELPAVCAALQQAVAARDSSEQRRLVHYLHNSALVIGDEKLASAAKAISRAESQADLHAALARFQAVLNNAEASTY